MGRYDVVVVLHIRVGPCSAQFVIELRCHPSTTRHTLGISAAEGNEVMAVIPKHDEGSQNLSLGFIANVIYGEIVDNLDFERQSIIHAIESMFQYITSYAKAWMANQKALEAMFSTFEDSYHNMPDQLRVMQDNSPYTHVNIVDSTHPRFTGNRVLKRAFFAFGACINAFRYYRLILCVVDTFLTRKYKGQIMCGARCLPLVGIVEAVLRGTKKYFVDRSNITSLSVANDRVVYSAMITKYMEEKSKKGEMHIALKMDTRKLCFKVLCREKGRHETNWSLGIPLSIAMREINSMEERSPIRMAPQGPHLTAPLQAAMEAMKINIPVQRKTSIESNPNPKAKHPKITKNSNLKVLGGLTSHRGGLTGLPSGLTSGMGGLTAPDSEQENQQNQPDNPK
uniref:PH01B031C15.19 protein n=1 Tax=Phyllostachys edulis TaxID=38705 RepID=L0P1U1_PHYED|nr:PH01B031C15.19 [Phyllostachys edulis]